MKNESSNLRSGGAEKQKTEEERGKELENILEPGMTQRAKGELKTFNMHTCIMSLETLFLINELPL